MSLQALHEKSVCHFNRHLSLTWKNRSSKKQGRVRLSLLFPSCPFGGLWPFFCPRRFTHSGAFGFCLEFFLWSFFYCFGFFFRLSFYLERCLWLLLRVLWRWATSMGPCGRPAKRVPKDGMHPAFFLPSAFCSACVLWPGGHNTSSMVSVFL